jgi:hypothetical protein
MHVADALEILQQFTLFGGELRRGGQMLQGTASANPKVPATRSGAIGGSRQYLDQYGFVHLPAPFDHTKAHPLAGQCALDEYRLAVDARDTAAVMGKIHDIGLVHLA